MHHVLRLLGGGLGLIALMAQIGCGSSTPSMMGSCAQETRAETYSAGMEKTTTSGVKVRLLSALPGPPERGDNRWTVGLAEAGGAALTGATLTVKPRMPDHGHGTTPASFSGTPATSAGSYDVGPFNLFMPGLWEVEVDVQPSGGTTEQVFFRFCIEG